MRTYLVAFILALAIAAILTPVVRQLAVARGWLDRNGSSRKIHEKPIPRLGGVAIVVAFFAPLVGLLIYENGVSELFLRDPVAVVGLFLGGLAIAGLGLYDDLRGADAKVKFLVQFGVATALYLTGFQIHQVSTPFGFVLPLGIAAFPFTLFWIAGVINAVNLIDGLDGLAAGVAFFATVTTFIIAALNGNVLMCLFTAALGGAILGFLLYNFNPASIFMGDTGSLFLGFVLAATSIQTSQKASTAVALIIPILALGLPIMDTLLAMARRFVRGRSMFSADREHIHHKLLELGFTHRQAVLVLYGFACLLGLAALGMTATSNVETTAILVVVGLLVVVVMRWLGYLAPITQYRSRWAEARSTRERCRTLRHQVDEMGSALRFAPTMEEVWERIRAFGPLVQATEFALLALSPERQAVHTEYRWKASSRKWPSPDRFAVRYPITGRDGEAGFLELAWRDGRTAVDRDDEIALEALAEHLAAAIAKVADTSRVAAPEAKPAAAANDRPQS